ncbi:hypothetical protein [Streptomyces mirabilis]|uniref:hypothetical protein n=1 Tax=Streptomyces mirabilis TaxID=68239 RepID=UPI0033AB3733
MAVLVSDVGNGQIGFTSEAFVATTRTKRSRIWSWGRAALGVRRYCCPVWLGGGSPRD